MCNTRSLLAEALLSLYNTRGGQAVLIKVPRSSVYTPQMPSVKERKPDLSDPLLEKNGQKSLLIGKKRTN